MMFLFKTNGKYLGKKNSSSVLNAVEKKKGSLAFIVTGSWEK